MTTQDTPETRPYAAYLQEIDRGRLHAELTEKLGAVIAAVGETGKAGRITLTLGIKSAPKTDGMVMVDPKVTVVVPELDRKGGLYFLDGASMVKTDPNQQPLGLRGLPADVQDEQDRSAAL